MVASNKGFMFHAVMSVGVGACIAQTNETVSGIDHVIGRRQAVFEGASGRIEFGNNEEDDDRSGTPLAWGAFNIVWKTENSTGSWDRGELVYQLTDVLLPAGTPEWESRGTYIFTEMDVMFHQICSGTRPIKIISTVDCALLA